MPAEPTGGGHGPHDGAPNTAMSAHRRAVVLPQTSWQRSSRPEHDQWERCFTPRRVFRKKRWTLKIHSSSLPLAWGALTLSPDAGGPESLRGDEAALTAARSSLRGRGAHQLEFRFDGIRCSHLSLHDNRNACQSGPRMASDLRRDSLAAGLKDFVDACSLAHARHRPSAGSRRSLALLGLAYDFA